MATLGSEVYEQLRQDVITGAFPPGKRLLLEMLRKRYGVGITPLREALYRLSTSLLVHAEDQRGFRVADVSLKHYTQILEARKCLEALALRDSIASGTIDWESQVVAAHHKLCSTPMTGVDEAITPQWTAAHSDFHFTLLSGAGNIFLAHFQAIFWDHFLRYRNILKPVRIPEAELRSEHERLMKAALARDPEVACALLTLHITHGSAGVLKALARSQDSTPADRFENV